MGLITSNPLLILSSFVHCVSVVLVAMYCQIEWCISQPQSALTFRSSLRTLNGCLLYHRNIIITHGKNIRIFITCHTTFIVHCYHVTGNALLQRTRSPCHNLLGEKYNDQKSGFLFSLPKTKRLLVPSANTMRTMELFPEPDLTSYILTEVTFSCSPYPKQSNF